jgi:hypothetical protein
LRLAIYEATRPSYLDTKTTWHGGLCEDLKVEGKTLDQVSTEASLLAPIIGGTIQFKTEDGRMVYEAYSEGYGKSKCANIREKILQEGKLITNRVRGVCVEPMLESPKLEG